MSDEVVLPALPLLVLVLAVATRVFLHQDARSKPNTSLQPRSNASTLSILVCMDASDSWRDYVNHIVMRCRGSANVNVLLTYRSADQVPDDDVADAMYRDLVSIEMGLQHGL